MKVNISVDDELMHEIDNVADTMYVSRSALFTLAMVQYLDARKVTNALCELSVCMRRIADNGEVDEQTKKELANLETLAKMFSAKA